MHTLAPPPTPSSAATRTAESLTDAELVARVRLGDDRAFEQLYARYHRRIAAYVNGMVKDHARAEDIAQDVFISALRRMRDTDRAITFKPWIYEIAKNACIDQFRRTRRTEEVSFDADGGLSVSDQGRLASAPGQPTPDQLVDQKASLDHLRGAFGGLSETHHEILVMRELEGLSYREIGDRLSMSRPSVESTLFRARRRLTEEYEQLVSGERCVRVQGMIASCVGQPTGSLGTRDQRRLAAHVSHCQPCRRHAAMSGIDPSELRRPHRVRVKVAAFLPLPAFLRRRLESGPVTHVGSGHLAPLANISAQLGGLDPAVASWAKAAATAVTIAVAGVGAGAAAQQAGLTSTHRALPAHHAAASAPERSAPARHIAPQRHAVPAAATRRVASAAPSKGHLPTVPAKPTGAAPPTQADDPKLAPATDPTRTESASASVVPTVKSPSDASASSPQDIRSFLKPPSDTSSPQATTPDEPAPPSNNSPTIAAPDGKAVGDPTSQALSSGQDTGQQVAGGAQDAAAKAAAAALGH